MGKSVPARVPRGVVLGNGKSQDMGEKVDSLSRHVSLYLLCRAQAGCGLQGGPTAAAQGCSCTRAEPGTGWGSWGPQT